MKNWLLSTGKCTDKVEYYVLDLFKTYFKIYPTDIPNASQIGFNMIITNTTKADLAEEVESRIKDLVNNFSNKFMGLNIRLDSVELISEEEANVVVSVNQVSDEVTINV